MPSKFTGSLQSNEPTDYQPAIRHDDTLSTIANAAKDVGAVAFERIDKGILDNVVAESTGVLGEVASYKQRERELLLASSVADKAHLDQYARELARLRSGEAQGRVSPAMATAKLSILSKETQKRYPHLESQIRAVTDQSISGVRAISAESDKLSPDEKAAYDIVEKAAGAGMTPEEYMGDIAAERRAKQTQRAVDQAGILGQGLETATRAHMTNLASVALNQVIGGIVSHARAGTVIKEDELAQLSKLQSDVTRTMSATLTEQELKTGAKFSQGFRDALIKEVNDQFSTVTTMVNNMDTIEKQKKFMQWADEKSRLEGRARVVKDLGYLGQLALLGQNPIEVLKSALDFKYKLEHGMLSTVEKLAQDGDVDASFMLNAWKSDLLPAFAMPNMDKAGRGEPTSSSGNKVLDKVSQGFVLNGIGDPKIPIKTRQNWAKSLVRSQGMFEHGLETALEHRGTIPFIQSDPAVQTEVVAAVENQQRAGMHSLTPEGAPTIVYNSVRKQFEVDPVFLQQQKADSAAQTRGGKAWGLSFGMPYGSGSGLPSRIPSGVQETISAANLGIKAYTMMGKDVPGYVKDVFERINKAVNPMGDTAEEPKAAATPAPRAATPKDRFQVTTDGTYAIWDRKFNRILNPVNLEELVQSSKLSPDELAQLNTAIDTSNASFQK